MKVKISVNSGDFLFSLERRLKMNSLSKLDRLVKESGLLLVSKDNKDNVTVTVKPITPPMKGGKGFKGDRLDYRAFGKQRISEPELGIKVSVRRVIKGEEKEGDIGIRGVGKGELKKGEWVWPSEVVGEKEIAFKAKKNFKKNPGHKNPKGIGELKREVGKDWKKQQKRLRDERPSKVIVKRVIVGGF